MKFLALFTKDFLAIRLLVILVLVALGAILSMETATRVDSCKQIWRQQIAYNTGMEINTLNDMRHDMKFQNAEFIFIWACFSVSIVLGFWHFWMPRIKKTEAFNLHRPCQRGTILTSRILAGVSGMIICLLLPWTANFVYMRTIAELHFRPLDIMYVRSLGYFTIGIFLYLTVALIAMSKPRSFWRVLPVVLGYFMIVLLFADFSYQVFFLVVAIGLMITVVRLYKEFLTTEF